MAIKEREITIKVIKNKKINIDRLSSFFAKEYSKNKINNKNIKS